MGKEVYRRSNFSHRERPLTTCGGWYKCQWSWSTTISGELFLDLVHGSPEIDQVRPIFDTNVFGLKDESARRFLRLRRPPHGWPLSLITALELLAGLDGIPEEKFENLRAQLGLAFELSRGRVLEDPTPMLCREVLHVPFPPRLVAPSASILRRHMDIMRRAKTVAQLFKGVPYHGAVAGFKTTSVVNDIVNNLKLQWVSALENIAAAKNPAWRELFRREGRRLPPEMRRELAPLSTWEIEKHAYAEQLLRDLLEATPEPALVDVLLIRFSAVLEFSIFVVREFLIGNYSIEKHSSDVFDQFQLRYLAMDKFVIVTNDADLSKRVARSLQIDRVISLDGFLETL